MGRPAISEDDLATLLVVGEVSIGVRLGAALSTASPCSSTQPLQSPLFADTAPAVAEKAEAEAEAEAHGQGQRRQGLSASSLCLTCHPPWQQPRAPGLPVGLITGGSSPPDCRVPC